MVSGNKYHSQQELAAATRKAENLRKRIRIYLTSRNESQKDFAKEIGVGNSTFSRFMSAP